MKSKVIKYKVLKYIIFIIVIINSFAVCYTLGSFLVKVFPNLLGNGFSFFLILMIVLFIGDFYFIIMFIELFRYVNDMTSLMTTYSKYNRKMRPNKIIQKYHEEVMKELIYNYYYSETKAHEIIMKYFELFLNNYEEKILPDTTAFDLWLNYEEYRENLREEYRNYAYNKE